MSHCPARTGEPELTGSTELESPGSDAIASDGQGKLRPTFAGDVATLVSGTTLAHLVLVLASPLVTRLYTPSAFGVAALFSSLGTVIGVIACLRYELAIVLPGDDDEAAGVFAVSVVASVVVSVACGAALLVLRGPILHLLRSPELGSFLPLVPLSVCLRGLLNSLTYWSTRRKNFSQLSVARFVGSTTMAGAQLGLGFGGLATPAGLILSEVLRPFASSVRLAYRVWGDDWLVLRDGFRLASMLPMLRRYRKFPLVSGWAAIMNTISWQLPSFLLAAYFSPVIVGFYSLGDRVLRRPMSLISLAIGQVFLQRAAQAQVEGKLTALVESSFTRLVRLGMFPFVVLSVVGQDLFVVLFGSYWAEAGFYAQILSLWTFVWFISSPLSSLYSVLELQERSLYINIAILVTRYASLTIGGIAQNSRLGLFLFGVSGVLAYGYYCTTIMRVAGVALSSITGVLWRATLQSLPAAALLLLLQRSQVAQEYRAALAVIMIGAHMGAALWTDPEVTAMRLRRG